MQFQEQIFWAALSSVRIWNSGHLGEKLVFLHLRISKMFLLQANEDFEQFHRNLKHPIKIKTMCKLKNCSFVFEKTNLCAIFDRSISLPLCLNKSKKGAICFNCFHRQCLSNLQFSPYSKQWPLFPLRGLI
jgi:hypothetical protein